MATVVGYDKVQYKRFTCYNCYAIVEYTPNEVNYNGVTDEGIPIKGLMCPSCYSFHITNP